MLGAGLAHIDGFTLDVGQLAFGEARADLADDGKRHQLLPER
jgi:hypothetical protein